MPRARRLEILAPDELTKIPQFVKPKKYRVTLSAGIESTADAVRRKLDDWAKSVPAPTAATPKVMQFKAVKFAARDLSKLRQIRESKYATAEIINQKLSPTDLLGLVYSAVVVNNLCNMKEEYERRLRAAKTRLAKNQLKRRRKQMVKVVSMAFSRGGIRDLKEEDLGNLIAELKRSRANHQTVQAMANTGVIRETYATWQPRVLRGQFLPSAAVLPPVIIETYLPDTAPDLCEEPIVGTHTDHISESFSIQVCMDLPCPTCDDLLRWCRTCFTVAGASFSISVNFGYKIDCHGISAWGCGSAQACFTLLGVTVCAQCSACVAGVASVASASSAGMCTYGSGLKLDAECKLAGLTLFSASVPLELSVSAPCP